MNKLTDLIKTFVKVDDWKGVVKENFERKSGTYAYVTVAEIEIKYDKKVFRYPTKVVFEYGYIKAEKNITKQEKLTLDKKPIKITERKKIIPLGFYQRGRKYSGDIFQIIGDILGNNKILTSSFSNDLLTSNDNPLYSIDSKQKWASYILTLHKEGKHSSEETNSEQFSTLNEILNDYGIHYSFDAQLQNTVIVIFPMPYLKVVENKIKKNDNGESIFMVLEFNQLGLFYSSQLKIEIDGIIKNLKNEVVYQKVETLKFAKAKYQVVELYPEQQSEIGYSSFSIKINGTLVDKFSGYYIREINLDIKSK
ncbi:MAG: hypothetical protein CVT94_16325 [Bacteroidetes bacterium HGW-Bacteroidetes-11]|nr:MAG: hypothetical protein CVT94_16325 [Bacteroidetes bacterium HGW-Bacteroidetes-11]